MTRTVTPPAPGAGARRQRHWDWRAAGNFIGGGTGSGLILAAAFAALLDADLPAPAWPLLAGMACVAAGLSLVWLEIGKPWRALNVFFHPQTSWMTREGIVASPLLACSAAAAWSGAGVPLVGAALLAAGYLYCQARILRASRAIPAWSHPRVVPLIVACGLAEGSGALLLLGGAGSRGLVALALAATLARELALEHYRRGLAAGGAPAPTLAWFSWQGHPATRVLQGLRLLAALLLLAVLMGWGGAAVAAAGGAIALGTGWALKLILVTRAAYQRGAQMLHLPVRGRRSGAL
ncbi:MAG: hypothetical protein QM750_24570 [Rubrivivax sp.]